MISTLAAVPTWAPAVGVVFFLAVCVVLILIVLIQRPQGGGLGGAFGGGAAGSGQTAFGAKTGDVLTWATIGIFLLFITLASVLNFIILPPTAQNSTMQAAPAGTNTTIPAEVPPATVDPITDAVDQIPTPSDQTSPADTTDPGTSPAPTQSSDQSPDPAPAPTTEPPSSPGAGGS